MLSERAIVEFEDLITPPDDDMKLYGIIDGASVPEFLELAEQSPGQHACLFAGTLAPEVEKVAPHLVELVPNSELAGRWWRKGWGEHWGIMVHIPAKWSFDDVRRWFRTFLRVQLPDGRYVLFRYYDPRVLRKYLPTCTAEETAAIFGPVTAYFTEDENVFGILRFTIKEDGGTVGLQRAALYDHRRQLGR